MPLNQRTIFHVDMDSFYASVEEREHPEHRGKPIIIGADPKGGSGRGVVAACSYAAREFGVHSAMPISRAYKACPHGVYLPPRFDLYDEVSDQIMAFLSTFKDRMEQVSIDEAFLDVSKKVAEFEGPEKLAEVIQQGMKEQFQLTCSIGIAHNKSIAKIASDFKKPAGITYVPFDKFQEFLDPLTVDKISGVGPKTKGILNSISVYTIQDLREAKKFTVIEALGNYGLYLMDIAVGKDDRDVEESWGPSSSTSHESTFHEDTSDFGLVEQKINEMAKRLCRDLEEHQQYYKTVTLKIRFEDFSTMTRSKSLNVYSQSYKKAMEIARELLKEFKNSYQKVRLVGLKLSNLKKLDSEQETLWKWQ